MKRIKLPDVNLFSYQFDDILSADYKHRSKNIKDKLSVSITSSYTTDYFSEFLEIFFNNNNINLNINNQIYGDLIFNLNNKNSTFWKKNCDFIILLPDSSILNLEISNLNRSQIEKKIKSDAKKFMDIWKFSDKPIIQSLINFTQFPMFGLNDSVKLMGGMNYLNSLNQYLISNAPAHVTLVDLDYISKKYDVSSSLDYRMYSLIKQPYKMEFVKFMAHEISSHIFGKIGKSKKVLVVDLDNTIWGGIVGDIGWKKIKLGPDTIEGQSFFLFQKFIKKLIENGILLCVASKNDSKIVYETFKKNKHMVLKLSDIVAMEANYQDKATNIKNISKKLNIGLDSFVFIDDSKVECELVKNKLKDVSVINMDGDPYSFINLLDRTSLFNFSKITKEDKARIKSYKFKQNFDNQLKKTKNIDNFLKSLKPKINLKKIDKANYERVLQLFGKTNQFKFNKKIFNMRYLAQNRTDFIVVEFKDKFQNYGVMSSISLKKIKRSKSLEIVNWVLSCRIFSRKIENYLLKKIIKDAKLNNLEYLKFKFINSGKNHYLINFLDQVGIKVKNNGNYKIKIKDIKINE